MSLQHGKLQRLAVALHAGRPVPEDVAEWLLNGIALQAHGASLERVLGLSSGKISEKKAERDKWICEAATILFCRYGDYSEGDVAVHLAAEVRKIYASQAWRFRRSAGFPSIVDDTQAVRGCLENAFSCVASLDVNTPVPSSPKQLARIIIENET